MVQQCGPRRVAAPGGGPRRLLQRRLSFLRLPLHEVQLTEVDRGVEEQGRVFRPRPFTRPQKDALRLVQRAKGDIALPDALYERTIPRPSSTDVNWLSAWEKNCRASS